MQYTAAIFDIDGTLLPKGDKAPSLALQNAIKALQDDGICVIIATGRAHFSAKAVLGSIKPDYLLA
ncbi:MAG: HAD hydrolase family protein, partial [Oscillospiraceae bacterium]